MQVYRVGKVVRTCKNKLDRLTLKSSVIYHSGREKATEQEDKEVQIKSFYNEVKAQHQHFSIKVGEKVQA